MAHQQKTNNVMIKTIDDFIAESDSRLTSPELMSAIYTVAGNYSDAVLLWENGPTSGELVSLIEIVTNNGRAGDTSDFMWGDAGINWADTTQQHWTPHREHKTPWFHMVANGDALFTSDVNDSFRCIDKQDCINLCEALEDTSPDNWKPLFVTVDSKPMLQRLRESYR